MLAPSLSRVSSGEKVFLKSQQILERSWAQFLEGGLGDQLEFVVGCRSIGPEDDMAFRIESAVLLDVLRTNDLTPEPSIDVHGKAIFPDGDGVGASRFLKQVANQEIIFAGLHR